MAANRSRMEKVPSVRTLPPTQVCVSAEPTRDHGDALTSSHEIRRTAQKSVLPVLAEYARSRSERRPDS